MHSFLSYIPTIFTNPVANAVTLTTVPAIFYTLAAYGQLYITGIGLAMKILVSIFFAVLEYTIRVPINQYSSDVAGMSNTSMQLVWVILTLGFAGLSDKLFPLHSS
jgi:uncharacterized protein (DUF486 family)